MTSQKTREGWLSEAIELLRELFTQAGYSVPEKVHVSVGFPSTRALSAKKQRIGECWHPRISADGFPHVFISPVLNDGPRVLGVLVHELIHAAIGTEHGHKKPFAEAMVKLGLEGKPTATTESPALTQKLEQLIEEQLGDYPHPTFNAQALKEEKDKKKQSTRLLKAVCPSGDETDGKVYTVRITRVHLDHYGAPICPACEQRMTVEGGDAEGPEGE